MATEEQVIQQLKQVTFPGLTRDIVSFGFVKDIRIEGEILHVAIRMTSENRDAGEQVKSDATRVLNEIDGINDVRVDVEVAAPEAKKQAAGFTPDPDTLSQARIKIAVASGKGGVGKSTVSTNLACALKKLGWSVGMLDADIYGPSQQIMMGIKDGKLYANQEQKILPVHVDGIQMISIGFMGSQDSPLIWRGPMVMKALDQFIKDVAWEPMDALIIDLPPGTGDAQLTLCQTLPLNGVVIVTTPQDVALVDARKGLQMFKRLEIPVLGIVENMSTFVCPHCGEKTPIFKSGGGRLTSEELGVPLLGEIPIDPALPPSGDDGKPLVIHNPESPAAEAFMALAQKVIDGVGGKGS